MRPSDDVVNSPVDRIMKESAVVDGSAPILDQRHNGEGNPFQQAVDPDKMSKVYPEGQPDPQSLDLRKAKE